MEIIEERREERIRRINLAERFVSSISDRLSPFTAIVIGSTVRGDFNRWSDVDVILVSDRFPDNPIERFKFIEDLLIPGIESIPLRMTDIRRLVDKRAPVVRDMVKGVFIRDELHLRNILKEESAALENKMKERRLIEDWSPKI